MIIKWEKEVNGNNIAGLNMVPLDSGEMVRLLPGNNEISNKDWKEIKQHKSIQQQMINPIEIGRLTEVVEVVVEESGKRSRNRGGDDKPSEDEKKVIKNIHKMSAKKAVDVIADTYDLDTLDKWKEEEHRDEVRAAISKQIDLVNAPEIAKT